MTLIRMLFATVLTGAAVLIGAQSALAYEWDIAKPGNPPSGMPCAKATGVIVCFESEGEEIWVKDTDSDEMSAVAKWRAPNANREGYCRNKSKVGTWAYCDKSFLEGRLFEWWGARYDRDTNKFYGPWTAGKSAHA
jgi:hypothetical protein